MKDSPLTTEEMQAIANEWLKPVNSGTNPVSIDERGKNSSETVITAQPRTTKSRKHLVILGTIAAAVLYWGNLSAGQEPLKALLMIPVHALFAFIAFVLPLCIFFFSVAFFAGDKATSDDERNKIVTQYITIPVVSLYIAGQIILSMNTEQKGEFYRYVQKNMFHASPQEPDELGRPDFP
jgi:hypothetical protein